MTACERAVAIACGGETLIGVLALPASPAVADDAGVVIVVGGPQYRAGSHRQFVLMARSLAAAGHAVLRFDVRGMGDSTGVPRGFEAIDEDIAAAIDFLLRTVPTIGRIVLCGLCDGASAALLYCRATGDRRVQGLCLLNPWVRSTESLARTHVRHYYVQRLFQPSFWKKVVGRRVAAVRFVEFLRNLYVAFHGSQPFWRRSEPSGMVYQRRMAEAWRAFGGPILLVLSSRDFTAKEFSDHIEHGEGWNLAFDREGLERYELADADHTFSDGVARVGMEALTVEWLRKWTADPARTFRAAREAMT